MDEQTPHTEMTVKGVPAAGGLARGTVYRYRRDAPAISGTSIPESAVGEHLEKWEEVREKVDDELTELAVREQDEEAGEILQAQLQVVRDPDLRSRIEREVEDRHHPLDYAIRRVFDAYLELIRERQTDDRDRSVDLSDIRDRLIELVHGASGEPSFAGADSIVVARELSAREIIQLSGNRIRAIVTEKGGTTSHAAIIARSMGIPTVVGAGTIFGEGINGCEAIVDGDRGVVVLHPGRKARDQYDTRFEERRKRMEQRTRLCRKSDETADGQPFVLRANIEFPEEIENLKRYCAKGIGLLRTESIYLTRSHFDDQQKQEEFYSGIMEGSGTDPVTIRLFDAGGDKISAKSEPEENPFLGWRGIRMLLDERGLLREQLEAILKVAGRYPGRVRILIPMVTNPEEVEEVRTEMETITRDLESEGIDTDPAVKLGVMVEVPSVALQAEMYGGMVDFFSIGTNDLTQYTLAVDRGNEQISRLYDQRHPAVWRLIQHTCEAARSAGIDVALCGELASDPVSAACLIGIGVTDLSMSPAQIPDVKKLLIGRKYKEMKALAEQTLRQNTLSEINTLFNNWNNQ